MLFALSSQVTQWLLSNYHAAKPVWYVEIVGKHLHTILSNPKRLRVSSHLMTTMCSFYQHVRTVILETMQPISDNTKMYADNIKSLCRRRQMQKDH